MYFMKTQCSIQRDEIYVARGGAVRKNTRCVAATGYGDPAEKISPSPPLPQDFGSSRLTALFLYALNDCKRA